MALSNFSWIIPGKLAGSERPGGLMGGNPGAIENDLNQLHAEGVRLVVSLENMPSSFRKQCMEKGMEWVSFPIKDFDAPDNKTSFAAFIDAIILAVRQGKPVCVHCRAGIGRTGLVLACVLGKYLGIDSDKAIAAVRSTRTALETEEQVAFVKDFCSSR